MAYLKKRGSNWSARITWYESGERKAKEKSGFKTKKEAKTWANKYEVQKDNHEITDKDPAFADYYLDWAKTYRIPGKSTTSIKRYYLIYKYLKEYFGNGKLSRINHRQYQKFINWYGQRKAKSTVQKNHGTIKACVEDARLDNLVPNNFAARTNLIWDNSLTRKRDYLSANEVKDLLSNLNYKRSPKYTSRYMIITALFTGMRIGEILALEWTDINYSAKTINITKSYDYIDQQFKEPKTKSSVRNIKVNQELLDVLKELKANNQRLVFANSKGNLPSPAGVNKVLRQHLKQCGINRKTLHFHSLRHTHASMLLFGGVQLYAISKRLGHSNMLVTAKVYSHMINEYKAQQDKNIENVLNKFNDGAKMRAL